MSIRTARYAHQPSTTSVPHSPKPGPNPDTTPTQVDLNEFRNALTKILPEVRTTEIESLFYQFDTDKSGFISYNEMRDTLKSSIVKVKTFQMPPLPRDLQSRKRDVLELHRELESKRRNNYRVAPGVNLPTFEEALRLYYPKDTKEKINILCKWVIDVMEVKAEAAEARMHEADSALIKEIDTDGSGTISLAEFVELSKRTGLSKVQMRARFREKDYGNAGELTLDQMREVLHEVRDALSTAQPPPIGKVTSDTCRCSHIARIRIPLGPSEADRAMPSSQFRSSERTASCASRGVPLRTSSLDGRLRCGTFRQEDNAQTCSLSCRALVDSWHCDKPWRARVVEIRAQALLQAIVHSRCQ